MDRMPIIFIGHGSPMNAIEDNSFTREWVKIAKGIKRPKAILSVSAHWFTTGTRIMDDAHPQTIYDMYGFPKELYEVIYDAPGSPETAKLTKELISSETIIDNTWGLDHGTWSVLVNMYPERDIPVFQLSVDRAAPPRTHYEIGQQLKALRDKGVLVLGSGNIVHHLGRVNWSMEHGYDWAREFDGYIKENILSGKIENIIDYTKAGPSALMAVPAPDHFYPLLYILGASDGSDRITVHTEACIMGSLSMTSYVFTPNVVGFEES